MKTVFDSDPEFSLRFSHCGVSAVLSLTVSEQDFPLLLAPGEHNADKLFRTCSIALPAAAQAAVPGLLQAHHEFSRLLHEADMEDYRAYLQEGAEGVKNGA